MKIIKETELILTNEQKIYHLNLSKKEIAKNIILVGDPNRVKQISDKFDNINFKISNREFTTHTGEKNNQKISVISTGIGTDNIDIVINELDALFNIDFSKRKIKKQKTKLNIFRLGTSGSIQQNVRVDSIVASSFGLGLDGLAYFYEKRNILEEHIQNAFIEHTNWHDALPKPYIIKASEKLLKMFPNIKQGITATAPGFYGPQGRKLRLDFSINNFHKKLSSFSHNNLAITNFEMETSALYYLGRTLGHNTLTICAIIGNRVNKSYSKNYKITIDKMIDLVLEKIC